MRLNPAAVVQQLRAEHGPGDEDVAEQVLAHLREALLSGVYVAVEDDLGHTFVGTEAEAVEYMMAHSRQRPRQPPQAAVAFGQAAGSERAADV